MTKKQTVIVKLRRSSRNQPWGIRIAGGADLGTAIVVTRSENEELQKGDVIKKIDDYDVRDVRHVDAQNLLQKSDCIRLVVERSEPSNIENHHHHHHHHRPITIAPPTRSPARSPILKSIVDLGPPVVSLPKILKNPRELPKSPIPPPSVTPLDEYRDYSPTQFGLPNDHFEEIREERAHLYQPYRTTPLVLPGAKVKKDAPIGECYLRHHPNPMIRAAPHHYDPAHPEVAMKQKVAETVLQRVLGPNEVPKVVHKQFNSPIGLYSEQNIADTIKCQTSAVPVRKPVKYDPSKSEAYKALQEEALGDTVQEVRQPARTGVFTPQRNQPNKIHHAPKSPVPSYGGAYRRPFPLPFVKDRVNGF